MKLLDRATLSPDQAGSIALSNFAFEMRGIRLLLDFYDDATKDYAPAKRDPNLEYLKRAGIILVATAWETLIETILTIQFEDRLANASSPDEVRSPFNRVAEKWLGATKAKPKPPDGNFPPPHGKFPHPQSARHHQNCPKDSAHILHSNFFILHSHHSSFCLLKQSSASLSAPRA